MWFPSSKYSKKIKSKVQCTLCPHFCLLAEGKTGKCGVRRNLGGKIVGKNYGIASGFAIDPIEKKPLYHFYPGSSILSVGSWGCNFKCNFCQNWQISQTCTGDNINGNLKSVSDVVNKVSIIDNNLGIAFTYNEPTVWFEYMLDIAKEVKGINKHNVVVTNGYINKEPLIELCDYVDAFNVDLKGFSDRFYKEMAGGEIGHVLSTIKTIASKNKHMEITCLIIPGKNTNEAEFTDMVNWLADNVAEDVVLHLSRYFPRYKQVLQPTPVAVLNDLYEIAKEKLNYVYLGNVELGNITYCKNCNTPLIKRSGYKVDFCDAYKKGSCIKCKTSNILHV